MGKPKDITGEKFGRLTAIERTEFKTSNGSYVWHCRCDCGEEKDVGLCYLQRGATRSCGCMAKEQLDILIKSHGGSRHEYRNHPIYKSWSGLLQRSKSTTLKNYEDVTVCDEWNTSRGGGFINFLDDMGLPEEGQSINRIGGSKIYSKETCEWADNSIQGFDQKKNVRNTTGRTGVHIQDGKFRVRITKDGKRYLIGDFLTLEEAIKAREEAELKYYGFIKE